MSRRSNSMSRRFFALGLLLIAFAYAGEVAAEASAYVDRTRVVEGDTLLLTIESDDGGASQPDMGALSGAFDVLGTSTSNQTNIINGVMSRKKSWRISLMPKRLGTIEIPALRVGRDQTEPLQIEVVEASAATVPGAGDDVFIEVDIEGANDGIYVQQQVPIAVRLYSAYPIVEGALEAPRAENALIRTLGDDRRTTANRGGRRYQVVERHYVLSPESSGELRIAPIRFKGSIRDPRSDQFGGTRAPFGGLSLFETGRSVAALSKPLTLQVLSRPPDYTGAHWLPAERVTLTDSWTDGLPQLRVGEPSERTLTLEAVGLDGAQLPELSLPAPEGIRVYPEDARNDSRTDGTQVFGTREQTWTLIPTQEGPIDIPPVRITWWDTQSGEERVTEIPGWKLDVDPGLATALAPPVVQPEPEVIEQQGDLPASLPEQTEARTPKLVRTSIVDWRAVSAVLGILLVVVATLAFILYKRLARGRVGTDGRTGETGQKAVKADAAMQTLGRACSNQDANAAAQALLDWAAATWPEDPPTSLGAIARRLERGRAEVLDLERHLYAPNAAPWSGSALSRVLEAGLATGGKRQAKAEHEVLPPLYPQRASANRSMMR